MPSIMHVPGDIANDLLVHITDCIKHEHSVLQVSREHFFKTQIELSWASTS